MTKKVTIECGFEEACLIERALELYSRVGILQFEYLTGCASLQKLIWDKNLSNHFRQKADELKAVFGHPSNGYPGIFNTKEVDDDARVAAHLYQQFRHERYLDREKAGDNVSNYGVDAYPADICQIAGMSIPNLKIKIESNDKETT